jgi:L-alanine-DL-glutamate epimerase-like enolase superfamily enzyme
VTALGKYDYQPKDGMYEIPNLPGIGQEMSEFAIESALAHVTVE